jgi:hypothetical protein
MKKYCVSFPRDLVAGLRRSPNQPRKAGRIRQIFMAKKPLLR